MKMPTLCAGLLLAVSAHAAISSRAVLTGRHVKTFAGAPLLICEYSGARAKFEILAQTGKCAPFIQVQ